MAALLIMRETHINKLHNSKHTRNKTNTKSKPQRATTINSHKQPNKPFVTSETPRANANSNDRINSNINGFLNESIVAIVAQRRLPRTV